MRGKSIYGKDILMPYNEETHEMIEKYGRNRR